MSGPNEDCWSQEPLYKPRLPKEDCDFYSIIAHTDWLMIDPKFLNPIRTLTIVQYIINISLTQYSNSILMIVVLASKEHNCVEFSTLTFSIIANK